MFAIGGILGFITISGIISGIMAVLSWFLYTALMPEINALGASIRATVFSLVWAGINALLTAIGMKRYARKWRKRISALDRKD